MNKTTHKRNIKKRHIALIILLVMVAGAGIYLAHLNQSLNETTEKIYEELERGIRSEKREMPVTEEDAISIALLGIDAKEGERGRSDTIVIITLNPEEESMYMFNIPRDTRTEIVGRGVLDKINHAHAFGGIDMAINTIENFLDIPIDYYAKVNMAGFVSIIDIFGGITVEVDRAFEYGGKRFEVGPMHMDGKTALAYSRMRMQDPRGDQGRNERQQQVIRSLIQEAASFKTITRVDSILEELVLYSKTNLQRQHMNTLFKRYSSATKNQKTLTIEGRGESIQGIYYFIVPEEERNRVSQILKDHLDL